MQKDAEDYDSFKLNCLSIFGLDMQLEQEEFNQITPEELSDKVYQEALNRYDEKNAELAKTRFFLS